ncbi:MAG: bifunctional hydroxymethylpyrimidine kinase/phosphomethylpyrimidine kinase [Armatimonadetes bacterium]|nr:bifunctional hydroxymethylpyrimidine kinase/phosphomethylpyrimidine kinase [Armatimonadota bacterium]
MNKPVRSQQIKDASAKVALSIAASDSSSGAGIQADLAVFRDIGVYGVCAVTNVTAQNSSGVHKIFKIAPRVIAGQIDAVTRDYQIGACKIGMLYSPQAVGVVCERIDRREIPNVVLDPVMCAKNGEILLTEPAVKRLKRWLMPKVTLVTPNAQEANRLTGIDVTDRDSARDAAKAIVEMGAQSALVKGGHISGEPVDVFYDGDGFEEYAGKRLPKTMHGTGCVLSAAIAARLALGDSVKSAIEFAKRYVTVAIDQSIRIGKGNMDYYVGLGQNESGPHILTTDD